MTGADREVVRRAERRIAVTVGCVVLLVVGVVAVLAWLAGRAEGREHARAEAGAEQTSDRSVATGLAGVLVVGALSAGAVGLVAARRAVRPVQDALAAQRRFVADASHELRTPLAVVHTRAELLLARTPADDPRRAVTAQLVEDTRVLGEVVTDLLVSAQMEGTSGELVLREPVEVAALLRAVAASFAAVDDDRRLVVVGEPQVVQAAPAALRRAVACLVDNALAHSPAGGRVELAVARDDARGRVLISVSDEGGGFPRAPEERRRLTERFERGPRSAPGHAGGGRPRFGLGLALVREVAERHGGRLVLGDRDGGGAVATVELPSS
ncbi:HAMP domain-containing sensor histidine kinase [Cellulomonas sp.]|uniref:sensor histidine kinase n=1 Tax=Cellulomonas sp. TaxID=40001 RepID=UPI001B1ED2A1|nr:HAMP domain-containing sensor histidine kinase [Cellulomonas sp.]MBO9555050.1 HAMP domain-containing histidine kinase [Cellulomonas sp.]